MSAGVGRCSSVGGSAGMADPCRALLYPCATARRNSSCVGSSSCVKLGVWERKLSKMVCWEACGGAATGVVCSASSFLMR
eukprot:6456390-Amphidinium_carterae.1